MRQYFRCRIVNAWERPSIMRKHICTGAMGGVYAFLMSGIFFVYFGNAVGLTRFQWGWMGGISSFLLSAQLVSAMLAQQTGRRKTLWFATAFAERTLRVVAVLAAFILWRMGWPHAGIVLIAGVCLSNFFGAMAAPPWLSWLADIIPRDEHGSFLGRRTAWINLVVMLAMVAGAIVMDKVPEAWKPGTAIVVFMVAAVIGLTDLVIHGTIPEPRIKRAALGPSLAQLIAPLKDRGFRPWLVFNTIWTFSMTLGGSLATLYFLDDLGIKNNFLGGVIVLTGCSLLGGAVTSSWSGRLVDRFGTKWPVLLGHLGWAVLPTFWIFATPRTALLWLTFASLWGGAFSTAATTAENKLVTRFPEPEQRPMYLAVSSCFASISGGLGAITAGTILKLAAAWEWEVAGWTFGAFHVLFALSFILRALTTFSLVPPLARLEPERCAAESL